MPSDKFRKLRDAKVILTDELPQEYGEVIEGLSPNEVNVLIDVKRRLEEADVRAGAEPAHYVTLIRF